VRGLGSALISWAPALLAAFGLLVLAIAIPVFVNSRGFGYDYGAYDAAARRIAVGESPYVPGTVDAYRDGRYEGLFLYPPTLAIAFVPLTLLSESAATLAWMLLRVGLLTGGCLLLPIAWRARLATLGVACLSFPVLFDLNIGNVSIVVFFLCAVAWRWMDTPVAAVAHASLAAIRFPFAIFGFMWLVQRRLRMLAWTIAAGVMLILIGVIVAGLDTHAEYIGLLQALPDISTGPHNFSFKSVALDAGVPEPVASLALLISYLFGVVAITFAARRRDEATSFVVAATATLLISPFIHSHYLVLLLLPAAWLMDRGRWWGVALPLLGWLPASFLPFAGPFAIGLVLAASHPRVERNAEVTALSGA
jgi:glycosyl transferase family 87